MNKKLLTLALVALGTLCVTPNMEARRHRSNSGAAAAGFFAGAFAGAAMASSYNNNVVYVDSPYYELYYPQEVYYPQYVTYAYEPAYPCYYETVVEYPGNYFYYAY